MEKSRTIDDVRRMVAAGTSIPTAIKEAIGMTVSAFADKYDLPRGTTNEAITGGRRATDEQLAALIAELGGTPDEWRVLLWEAAKPVEEIARLRHAEPSARGRQAPAAEAVVQVA